jgi:hypothetical protein
MLDVSALSAFGLSASCFPVPVDASAGTVGSDCVVVVPPSFDQDLSVAQRVEDFAIEQFVSEPGI